MATNPMQKKTRTAFILGMLLMMVIAGIVIAMLYMTIENQKKELAEFQKATLSSQVYVLTQDVKSGQALTADMFQFQTVLTTLIPSNSTVDVQKTLGSYSLTTKDGRPIYYNPGTPGNEEDPTYYYVLINNEKRPIYVLSESSENAMATILSQGEKIFFTTSNTNGQKVETEVAENAVVAKVDLKANTVLTGSLIARTDEITTDDLKKEEYNIISLPVDLLPDEYIDVRLQLPSGQNYVVVSKKKVSIPMVAGEYLPDTIQMNLTEEEILMISCAIVENFKIEGSKLYASRYVEAGIQDAAVQTYYPSNEVHNLIVNDPNVVQKAIKEIYAKRESIRKGIDSAESKYGKDEDLVTKNEESITSSQEARKNYLQSLTGSY